MNEEFRRAWNVTGTKFTPGFCEWLAWLGQPLLYDGGLCVNRSPEEHRKSLKRKTSLVL